MKEKMMRIIVLGLTLIVLAGPTLADSKISLRLQGSWSYISSGDVNPGTKAWFDYHQGSWAAYKGGYLDVHGGYEFGADVIYELTSRLGAVIGIGLLEVSRLSDMLAAPLEIIGPEAGISARPKLSAVALRTAFYFSMPLSRKLHFQADAGPLIFLGARYRNEMNVLFWSMDTDVGYITITTRAHQSKLPIGFHGGLGLEYELWPDVFIHLGANGRYAELTGWTGTSVLQSDLMIPFSEEGTLYYEVVPMLTDAPRLIMVQNPPPDVPGAEPRQAVINFSGISLQLGIRVRL